MIDFIFTIDYEIYGNGEGSLRELVYEPAERLMAIFRKRKERCVIFAEVAELELMEAEGSDPDIDLVKKQLRELYSDGFEIGLHLHPQWYNARYEKSKWKLDYSEYNLCTLPKERIVQIVDRSLAYLRAVIGEPDFIPFSFRAGNWLFQPTQTAASVLAERGIKVDSSVFKGGLQHLHHLDYRRALRNGYYWTFSDCVDVPDPQGSLLELPIFTQMVPIWKMLTARRIGIQRKGTSRSQNSHNGFSRYLDFLRLLYPMKLDFCRMEFNEFVHMLERVIHKDKKTPQLYKPIVAIGHTKDLRDFEIIDSFLAYLERKGIPIVTLNEGYGRCNI